MVWGGVQLYLGSDNNDDRRGPMVLVLHQQNGRYMGKFYGGPLTTATTTIAGVPSSQYYLNKMVETGVGFMEVAYCQQRQ